MLQPHREIVNGHEFWMLPVEGGVFYMGDELGDFWDVRRPIHPVKVSSFGLGKFPVTQALWKAILPGKTPSRYLGDDRPVERISWDEITTHFLPKLCGLTNIQYRLPTEAEWEYAARGGKYHTDGYQYSGGDRLKDLGWYAQNSHQGTSPVGLKAANQLGIYDMSGNVWEWCADWYDELYYKKCIQLGLVDNPVGPPKGKNRVGRGGGWSGTDISCSFADRSESAPARQWYDFGFRLAFSLQADGSPVPATQ